MFWGVMPWRQYFLPKPWYLPGSPCSSTTQNNFDIFTALGVSNLMYFVFLLLISGPSLY